MLLKSRRVAVPAGTSERASDKSAGNSLSALPPPQPPGIRPFEAGAASTRGMYTLFRGGARGARRAVLNGSWSWASFIEGLGGAIWAMGHSLCIRFSVFGFRQEELPLPCALNVLFECLVLSSPG